MLFSENEDDGNQEDKTEEPSERKLEKSYEEGQIFISRELNNWVIVGTSLIVILLVLPISAKYLSKFLAVFLAQAHGFEITPKTMGIIFYELSAKLGLAVVLPLTIYALASISIGLLQSHKAISVKKLIPKFSNLSLKKGFSKIFSKESVMELIKGSFKIAIISTAIYFVFIKEVSKFEQWIWLSWASFISTLMGLTFKLIFIIFIILSVVAGFDYWYQRSTFMKKMRMSHQEIKEEHKEQEGAPEIRQKLRQVRQERSRKRITAAIQKATVVITNPTHFAVALHWDESAMQAPKVVAKGQDYMAQTIRELAKQYKVPIIENPPLARSLFNNVPLDYEISPEHYQAVADIIKLVTRMKRGPF